MTTDIDETSCNGHKVKVDLGWIEVRGEVKKPEQSWKKIIVHIEKTIRY